MIKTFHIPVSMKSVKAADCTNRKSISLSRHCQSARNRDLFCKNKLKAQYTQPDSQVYKIKQDSLLAGKKTIEIANINMFNQSQRLYGTINQLNQSLNLKYGAAQLQQRVNRKRFLSSRKNNQGMNAQRNFNTILNDNQMQTFGKKNIWFSTIGMNSKWKKYYSTCQKKSNVQNIAELTISKKKMNVENSETEYNSRTLYSGRRAKSHLFDKKIRMKQKQIQFQKNKKNKNTIKLQKKSSLLTPW